MQLLELTFVLVWAYFASVEALFVLYRERESSLASGAFSLALRTNSRFAAEEDKHALVGILLSPGINLSI